MYLLLFLCNFKKGLSLVESFSITTVICNTPLRLKSKAAQCLLVLRLVGSPASLAGGQQLRELNSRVKEGKKRKKRFLSVTR